MFPKPKRIRNRQLLDRVKSQPCVISDASCRGVIDPQHITTVGHGGHDVENNVMPLCRAHHTEMGWSYVKMFEKYPAVREWLIQHGRQDILERKGKC